MNLRPRTMALAIVSALALSALTVVAAPQALAHGASTKPGSRTFLCYEDGHWTGGDLQPRNAACAGAVATGGKQPLWDWFGENRFDGGGKMAGYIPDGQLCSGGNPKYAAFDAPSLDWPVTHLTSGAPWTFHYNAWAPHPGVFRMFITKDGYDPTKPLTWDSLEATPFSTWSETTASGGEYSWAATLPAGKKGHHLIYSVWARTDSQETFYGCSDVVFDGGNGTVTGYPNADGGSGDATAVPTPSTTTVPPTTAPPTTVPATTVPPTTVPATTVPPTTVPATTDAPTTAPVTTVPATDPAGTGFPCTAVVHDNVWPGGYLGTVTVVNHGASQSPWTVTTELGANTTLFTGWNADVSLSGTTLTAKAPSWNATIGTGKEVSIGFVAAGAPATIPQLVRLNGAVCGGAGVPGATTPPPTTTVPVTSPPVPSSPAPSTVPPTTTTPSPIYSSTSPSPVDTPTPSTTVGSGTGSCTSSPICDGFENQTSATPSGLWTTSFPDCAGTGSVSIDNTVAYTGTHSVKVVGGAGYCNHAFLAATKSLATIGRNVYIRTYVRHTTALPPTHVAFMAMKDESDGGKDLRIGGQNSRLQWNRAIDDATLPVQSPVGVSNSVPLSTNTWHCLEVQVDGVNGHAKTWLDGAVVAGLTADGTPTPEIDGQWYGKTWRPNLSTLKFGWESYGGGTDTLWFDDIAVSTTKIGC